MRSLGDEVFNIIHGLPEYSGAGSNEATAEIMELVAQARQETLEKVREFVAYANNHSNITKDIMVDQLYKLLDKGETENGHK